MADRECRFPPLLLWSAGTVLLLCWWRVPRHYLQFRAMSLVLATASLAGCWHHVRWNFFPTDHYVRFAPVNDRCRIPIRLIGTVVSRPRFIPPESEAAEASVPTGDRTRFRLEVRAVDDGFRRFSASGLTTVNVQGHLLGVRVGQRVQIGGRLRSVPGPLNPGENDLRTSYRCRRQLGVIEVAFPDSVRVLRAGEMRLAFLVPELRGRGEAILRQHVSRDTYGLAAALLLGVRDSLPPSVTDDFFRTGTIHLLAVSGLHVGILAWVLLAAARGQLLPWRLALCCVMALTLIYALVAESRAPVVRASLLVQIVCVSWMTRRRLSTTNALSAAGLIVLLRSPAELFLVGTQLSFLAVATLGVVGARCLDRVPEDPIDRLIWRTRSIPIRALRRCMFTVGQLTLASLAVWLVTLPLVSHRFHLVSPWSVPLNLVLWMPLAVSLFAGMGVFVFHAWLPPAADLCGRACEVNLRLLQDVVGNIAQLPASHFWVAGPSSFCVAMFYAALAIGASWPSFRESRRCWALFALFSAMGLLTEDFVDRTRQTSRLRCTFIAVGHGTCVLFELPDGSTLLYDAGQLGARRSGVDRVANVLWARRVRRLDRIIVSHADADHFNLLPGLLDRFPAGTFYTGPALRSEPLLGLRQLAREKKLARKTLFDGSPFRPLAGCRIAVLHPPSHGLRDTDNANSIVIALSYRQHIIILPGDLENSGMIRLLGQPRMDTDLAMAPHHGSPRSNPRQFAEWCAPEWVVVSGGDPHVADRLQAELSCELLHTAQHGAVTVTIDERGMDVHTFREAPSR